MLNELWNRCDDLVNSKPNTIRFKYQSDHPFERRKAESTRMHEKYHDRIPVIVESLAYNFCDKKNKFLTPTELTVSQFMHVVRRRIEMGSHEGVYLFTERNSIPIATSTMGQVYQQYANDDGFLYISIQRENVYGNEIANNLQMCKMSIIKQIGVVEKEERERRRVALQKHLDQLKQMDGFDEYCSKLGIYPLDCILSFDTQEDGITGNLFGRYKHALHLQKHPMPWRWLLDPDNDDVMPYRCKHETLSQAIFDDL